MKGMFEFDTPRLLWIQISEEEEEHKKKLKRKIPREKTKSEVKILEGNMNISWSTR